MRSQCLDLSLVVINDYMGQGRLIYADSLSSMKSIVHVLYKDVKNV